MGADKIGVADRIEKCANDYQRAGGYPDGVLVAVANSLTNVMVSSYGSNTDSGRIIFPDCDTYIPEPGSNIANLNQKSEQLTNFDQKTNQFRVGKDEAELLATCMESKVGSVFLKSHIKAMAADCVAIVLPALSPDRAKRLGTYWQTEQQLICAVPSMLQKQQQTICESLVDINSLAAAGSGN